MRIGVVTTSYPRRDGEAAGCFVGEHVRFLAAAGHQVEVVAAGDGDGDGACDARADGAAPSVTRVASRLFYRGGAPEALEHGGLAGLVAAAGFSLAQLRAVRARAHRWDAMVAHWLLPSAVAARLAAPRLPLLAIAHSGDVHLATRLGLAAPLAGVLATPRTELVFVSDELRSRFLSAAPRPLARRLAAARVTPMGLDVGRFVEARLATACAQRSPSAPPLVAFVGRLVPVKGVDVLIDAAVRLGSRARVVVAGDGPLAGELRERAARALALGACLELIGEVDAAGRDRLFGAADVAVVPSRRLATGRSEGVPRVALEAMAAGAALVAAEVGGLAALPAAAARLVAPDDPGGLASAIAGLLADPMRRAAQVVAARNYVAGLDWSAVGPALVPAC